MTAFLLFLAVFFAMGVANYRNHRVHQWRLQILDRLHEATTWDILSGHDPRWRLEAYDQLTPYLSQWRQFWRPMDSFITLALKRALTIGETNAEIYIIRTKIEMAVQQQESGEAPKNRLSDRL